MQRLCDKNMSRDKNLADTVDRKIDRWFHELINRERERERVREKDRDR